jgi:hypothetical protein
MTAAHSISVSSRASISDQLSYMKVLNNPGSESNICIYLKLLKLHETSPLATLVLDFREKTHIWICDCFIT